jgi:hypothetical protein
MARKNSRLIGHDFAGSNAITSSAVGIRPILCLDQIVFPSTITSSAPCQPIRIFGVTPVRLAISLLRLPAQVRVSAHISQRLISIVMPLL